MELSDPMSPHIAGARRRPDRDRLVSTAAHPSGRSCRGMVAELLAVLATLNVPICLPGVAARQLTIAGGPSRNCPVQAFTAKSRHESGSPLSSWEPRSSSSIPDPATRSLTVEETSTSLGLAIAWTRAAT
jgi:hypothetical protein